MGRSSAPHPAVARAHLEDFVCSCRLVVTVPPTRDLRRFGRGFHVIVSPADRVCGTDTCHGCATWAVPPSRKAVGELSEAPRTFLCPGANLNWGEPLTYHNSSPVWLWGTVMCDDLASWA